MTKQEILAKMTAFKEANPDDPRDRIRISFIDSMKDNNPLASCLWIDEDGEIDREEFLTNEEAIAEMEKHITAFFIPKQWHRMSGCEWIWVETDEDEDSPTFGEELWCCEGVTSDEDGNSTARFFTMEKMWDKLLDYTDDDWKEEAYMRLFPWVKEVVAYDYDLERAIKCNFPIQIEKWKTLSPSHPMKGGVE